MATISITDVTALNVLRNFLLNVLPSGAEVVRAQVNRVPEPTASDWVLMTPLFRRRLATNYTTYSDMPGESVRYDMTSTEYTVQLDVHGPNSGDNAQIIMTLFRSDYAVDNFAANVLPMNGINASFMGLNIVDQNGNPIVATAPVDMAPLYTSEPRQMPFVNGERQYEYRWSLDAVMQINPVVTTTQDFAASLKAGIYQVDATYPP